MNKTLSLVLAEVRLNLRREFNGRYVVLDRFEDLKERVQHLEDGHAE